MRVAAPVAPRINGRRPAHGYLDLDGFVVVVTPDGPLLPNGVATEPPDSTWDPTLRLPDDPEAVGRTILAALGVPDAPPVDDPAALGERLIGRGPGLTPEGDDFVAGLAGVVAASGRDARVLLGRDLRRRTTALSATLLELGAAGMGPEPLQALLLGRPGALERLLRLGHSSGRAYALGAAAALIGSSAR